MEQIFCHLIGDYFLQNDWMASNKKKNFFIALLHSLIYAIPFIFVTKSPEALLTICITHAIIDGTHVIDKINQIKNWDFLGTDSYGNKDGYGNRPDHIRHWLSIIQDNTLHLIINYLSILYL